MHMNLLPPPLPSSYEYALVLFSTPLMVFPSLPFSETRRVLGRSVTPTSPTRSAPGAALTPLSPSSESSGISSKRSSSENLLPIDGALFDKYMLLGLLYSVCR